MLVRVADSRRASVFHRAHQPRLDTTETCLKAKIDGSSALALSQWRGSLYLPPVLEIQRLSSQSAKTENHDCSATIRIADSADRLGPDCRWMSSHKRLLGLGIMVVRRGMLEPYLTDHRRRETAPHRHGILPSHLPAPVIRRKYTSVYRSTKSDAVTRRVAPRPLTSPISRRPGTRGYNHAEWFRCGSENGDPKYGDSDPGLT
ncbi:hypothetical protein F5B17DRAFT_329491 [Nemania serpens]|nr:hypothetical protein F5B17DRAFT_329491 [Nemania serpens]